MGVLPVAGGMVDHVGASQNIVLGWTGGRGELNLTGGLVENAGTNVTVRESSGNSATGIVNLCSGTISLNAFVNYTGGTAFLSFGGCTLKAGTADSAAFIPNTMNGVYSYGPYSGFAGGAVIDSAGRNVTVAAPVRAPAGKGVTAITLADGGSGYIGEPYVEIREGGGVGACAVANMEDDGSGNGTYRVASVTITCPGTGYTSVPAVTFLRGGSTAVAPVIADVVLDDNTSGGLTKLGDGTLTLGAANTYTGVTTVAGGTLKLGNAAALPTQTRVVLAGGTLDLSGYTVTNTISGAGTLANGTVETVLSPGGEGVVATDTLPLAASVTLKGTYLLDVTTAGDSDLVAVQGDVNLDNLALQVVDPNLLDRTKTYTIMTCAGTRTGKFTPVNLPDSRWRVIYGADGSVKLFFVTGTVVILR